MTAALRTLPALLVALAPLAAAQAAASASPSVERFTGIARDGNGTLVYREDHEVLRDGARLLSARTIYTDPAGRTLATLLTDFSGDAFAPTHVFEDARTGEVEAVARAGAGLELRAGGRAKVVAPPSDPGRRLVSGQGLDRLVQARLAEVAAGTRLELAYAIPGRLDTYELRVRALGDASGPTVRVRAEFSSWILRLLAPSLDVEYDRETRRLLRYRGISNLTFDGGENPQVDIVYAYPKDAGAREANRASL
jgi:hypothetical protein